MNSMLILGGLAHSNAHNAENIVVETEAATTSYCIMQRQPTVLIAVQYNHQYTDDNL